jgi:hypothetical protein
VSLTPYGAHSWRVTAEVDSYDHAVMIGQTLRMMHPRRYVFEAFDEHGEPLWQEDGDPSMRPKDQT